MCSRSSLLRCYSNFVLGICAYYIFSFLWIRNYLNGLWWLLNTSLVVIYTGTSTVHRLLRTCNHYRNSKCLVVMYALVQCVFLLHLLSKTCNPVCLWNALKVKTKSHLWCYLMCVAKCYARRQFKVFWSSS